MYAFNGSACKFRVEATFNFVTKAKKWPAYRHITPWPACQKISPTALNTNLPLPTRSCYPLDSVASVLKSTLCYHITFIGTLHGRHDGRCSTCQGDLLSPSPYNQPSHSPFHSHNPAVNCHIRRCLFYTILWVFHAVNNTVALIRIVPGEARKPFL